MMPRAPRRNWTMAVDFGMSMSNANCGRLAAHIHWSVISRNGLTVSKSSVDSRWTCCRSHPCARSHWSSMAGIRRRSSSWVSIAPRDHAEDPVSCRLRHVYVQRELRTARGPHTLERHIGVQWLGSEEGHLHGSRLHHSWLPTPDVLYHRRCGYAQMAPSTQGPRRGSGLLSTSACLCPTRTADVGVQWLGSEEGHLHGSRLHHPWLPTPDVLYHRRLQCLPFSPRMYARLSSNGCLQIKSTVPSMVPSLPAKGNEPNIVTHKLDAPPADLFYFHGTNTILYRDSV
jgi:hypothetical protein